MPAQVQLLVGGAASCGMHRLGTRVQGPSSPTVRAAFPALQRRRRPSRWTTRSLVAPMGAWRRWGRGGVAPVGAWGHACGAQRLWRGPEGPLSLQTLKTCHSRGYPTPEQQRLRSRPLAVCRCWLGTPWCWLSASRRGRNGRRRSSTARSRLSCRDCRWRTAPPPPGGARPGRAGRGAAPAARLLPPACGGSTPVPPCAALCRLLPPAAAGRRARRWAPHAAVARGTLRSSDLPPGAGGLRTRCASEAPGRLQGGAHPGAAAPSPRRHTPDGDAAAQRDRQGGPLLPVSFPCPSRASGTPPPRCPNGPGGGLAAGLTVGAWPSEGQALEHPRCFRAEERALAKAPPDREERGGVAAGEPRRGEACGGLAGERAVAWRERVRRRNGVAHTQERIGWRRDAFPHQESRRLVDS